MPEKVELEDDEITCSSCEDLDEEEEEWSSEDDEEEEEDDDSSCGSIEEDEKLDLARKIRKSFEKMSQQDKKTLQQRLSNPKQVYKSCIWK